MPIEILSVSIKSLHTQPAGEGLPFLKGAVGDRMMATVEYKATEPHNAVRFRYGLSPNSTSDSDYSDADGNVQEFGGPVNAWMAPFGTTPWRHGGCRHENTGPDTWRITHFFSILPFPGGPFPPPVFDGTESPRYAFQIRTFIGATQVSEGKSTPVDLPGDCGWLGELFNGGAALWAKTTETGSAVDGELTFTLEAASPPAGPYSVSLHAVAVPVGLDPAKGLYDNYRYANAFCLSGGADAAGLRVQLLKAEVVSATELLVTARLKPGWYNGREVLIWAVIGNNPLNEADSIRQAVLLRRFTSEETETVPEGTVTLGEWPGAGFSGIGFAYHDDPDKLFSDVKAATKDTLLAKARLLTAPGWTIEQLTVEIQSPAAVFERRVFNLSANQTRNYILALGDEFNRVRFDPVAKELEYAFRIRWESWRAVLQGTGTQDWEQYPDIRFCVTARLRNGTQRVQAAFHSPAFQLVGYLGTIVEPSGPQVDQAEIQTYDAVTGQPLNGNLSLDNTTRVTAVFSGANALGLDTPEADLYGIISLDTEPDGGPQAIRQVSSIRPKEPGSPLSPANTLMGGYDLNGPQPLGFGKIEMEAFIAPGAVPANAASVVAARLDRKKGNGRLRAYRPIEPFCVQAAAATAFRPIVPFCIQDTRFRKFRAIDPFCFQDTDPPPVITDWRPVFPFCVQCQPYGTFHRVLCEDGILYNEYHKGDCGFFRVATGCEPGGGGGSGLYASGIFSEEFTGDGVAQFFDIYHNKQTRRYVAEVYRLDTDELVEVGIERITEDVSRVWFGAAPADGEAFEFVMTYLSPTSVPCCNNGVPVAIVGDGITSEFDLPHGLGRTAVVAAVYDVDTQEKVDCGFVRIDPDTLRVVFFAPPADGKEYEAVIV